MTTNTMSATMSEVFTCLNAAVALIDRMQNTARGMAVFQELVANNSFRESSAYLHSDKDWMITMRHNLDMIDESTLTRMVKDSNEVIRNILAKASGLDVSWVKPLEFTGELIGTPSPGDFKACVPFEILGVQFLVTADGYIMSDTPIDPCKKCPWNNEHDIYNCKKNCVPLANYKKLVERQEKFTRRFKELVF